MNLDDLSDELFQRKSFRFSRLSGQSDHGQNATKRLHTNPVTNPSTPSSNPFTPNQVTQGYETPRESTASGTGLFLGGFGGGNGGMRTNTSFGEAFRKSTNGSMNFESARSSQTLNPARKSGMLSSLLQNLNPSLRAESGAFSGQKRFSPSPSQQPVMLPDPGLFGFPVEQKQPEPSRFAQRNQTEQLPELRKDSPRRLGGGSQEKPLIDPLVLQQTAAFLGGKVERFSPRQNRDQIMVRFNQFQGQGVSAGQTNNRSRSGSQQGSWIRSRDEEEASAPEMGSPRLIRQGSTNSNFSQGSTRGLGVSEAAAAEKNSAAQKGSLSPRGRYFSAIQEPDGWYYDDQLADNAQFSDVFSRERGWGLENYVWFVRTGRNKWNLQENRLMTSAIDADGIVTGHPELVVNDVLVKDSNFNRMLSAQPPAFIGKIFRAGSDYYLINAWFSPERNKAFTASLLPPLL